MMANIFIPSIVMKYQKQFNETDELASHSKIVQLNQGLLCCIRCDPQQNGNQCLADSRTIANAESEYVPILRI